MAVTISETSATPVPQAAKMKYAAELHTDIQKLVVTCSKIFKALEKMCDADVELGRDYATGDVIARTVSCRLQSPPSPTPQLAAPRRAGRAARVHM